MNYFKEQSRYQEISVQMDILYQGEHVLYLDGAWQYGSAFEYRYHETMATLSACICPNLERVLICGGGDGLAARELLKYPNLVIDLVEIDEMMIKLYKTNKMLTDLNRNSLNSSRVNCHVENAIDFAKRSEPESYDLILLDFPSPGDSNRGKRYESLFAPDITNLFTALLRRDGVLTSQVSVPTEVIVTYAENLIRQGFNVWHYDATYNSEGNHDSFATSARFRPVQRRPIPNDCRLITKQHIEVGFSEATEITQQYLDYYRLFEYCEAIDVERG